jgi:hypothetical protein
MSFGTLTIPVTFPQRSPSVWINFMKKPDVMKGFPFLILQDLLKGTQFADAAVTSCSLDSLDVLGKMQADPLGSTAATGEFSSRGSRCHGDTSRMHRFSSLSRLSTLTREAREACNQGDEHEIKRNNSVGRVVAPVDLSCFMSGDEDSINSRRGKPKQNGKSKPAAGGIRSLLEQIQQIQATNAAKCHGNPASSRGSRTERRRPNEPVKRTLRLHDLV